MDVRAHDLELHRPHRVGIGVGPVVDHQSRLEVDRAFGDAERVHEIGGHGSEPGDTELVGLVPVSDRGLALRDRIAAGRQREPVDGIHEVGGGQIDHALAGRADVERRLRPRRHADDGPSAEPEDARHRSEVGVTVLSRATGVPK
ncbi:hypothetical protein GCM10025881_22930 [Pseudolysinimonas kribbensis]|uniref:Uncharacterized protein n=1 Tax=Pseudolysinimonas kribbensis TaxID=433641 RepID=A0ABQ6K7S1_9MICO|nr:hypothetical protein GCM10025881_22930 [Pseudolysinimonas kribbensis]